MKKGFSLVEIMVVIVIMGVLAVIGVPKLFGVIAKARAAEVPIAAGTYVNLQNAFLNEFNGVGSWKDIGYGAPGGSDGKTEYFEYTGCINGTIPFDNMEPDMPGWQASNRSKLNYCGAGSAWAVVIDPAGEKEIEYRRLISSPECEALTVNWGSVGATVEGMCEAAGELHMVEKDDSEPDTPQDPEAGSSASEDPSSSPGESTPSSDSNSEQQQQGDCDALAASIKNDNGNKYGWVCVSECGLFAPPGKARNAGFATDKSKKKKNTGGTCEKVEPKSSAGSNAGSSATQSSASSSASTTPVSSSNVTQATGSSGSTGGEEGGGTTKGSGSATGYKGYGDYKEYDSNKDVCLQAETTGQGKNKTTTCTQWIEAGYAGVGENASATFNQNEDACIKGTNAQNIGNCLVWVHQDECQTKQPTKNGQGVFCTEW